MLPFLLRVLSKFLLDRLAGESGCAHRVKLVTEDAHDLRGHRMVQESDGVFHLATVILRDRAFGQMLPSSVTDLLDVGKTRSGCTHGLVLLLFMVAAVETSVTLCFFLVIPRDWCHPLRNV